MSILELVPANPGGRADDGALCAQSDPALWYPRRGDTEAQDAAKAICRRCPLFFQCYAGAVARGEMWGIWGGVNFEPVGALGPEDEDQTGPECRRGHVFTGATTYWTPDGYRECRICRRDSVNRLAQLKREAPGATCGNKHVRTAGNTYKDAAGRLRCRDCFPSAKAAREVAA